jgi:hypothetical protein
VKKGHFYASTGVVIDEYRVTGDGIHISVTPQNDERTNIDFIGNNGKILHSVHSAEGEYKFSGDELYVRCRIGSTAGLWAWTQPVFLDDKEDAIEWTSLP